jgi:hypothetical protein
MIIFHPVPSGARLLCMSFTSLCMSFTSTLPEIAKVMKVSLATAKRHWTYARTWPYAELKDQGNSADQVLKMLLATASANGLTPAPGSLPSSRTGAIQKNLRIFLKRNEGFRARLSR